jgi:hypothetical protein
MSVRVRLLVLIAALWLWAAFWMAVVRLWDHESWGQVAWMPVVVLLPVVVAELRRRRRVKRSAPPPPL